MAQPFKPLTNLFLFVPLVINCFLTRAIADIKPSYFWLAVQVGTVEIPVAAPKAAVGIFGLQRGTAMRENCQRLLKIQH